jgi:hypothetical protein
MFPLLHFSIAAANNFRSIWAQARAGKIENVQKAAGYKQSGVRQSIVPFIVFLFSNGRKYVIK